MSGVGNFRRGNGYTDGDAFLSGLIDAERADFERQVHPLDTDEARATHKKLLGWWLMERDRQAENRLEMATDCDFYDNIQWDQEDAKDLIDRGQLPLVYNEVAPVADWLIGTERRARIDWRVMPRTEDDVQAADIKTKVLKYLSDVNRTQFVRSQAFEDCVKAGIGWIDTGARDDPTQETVYTRYEDWRNVLWDSAGSYDLSLNDARYVFRWRWVDEDVAALMFEDRQHLVMQAMEDHDAYRTFSDEELLNMGPTQVINTGSALMRGSNYVGTEDTRRRRVRLIECQFKVPARVKIIASGAFKGAMAHPNDEALIRMAMQDRADIIDRVVMRTHFAVMTESGLLALSPSIYRHNRYTLTPLWCYRRGRDRLPYGVIRRIRDVQKDLNKRASKALFLFNTNQVLREKGAIPDINRFMDELGRPDGDMEVEAGALQSNRVQIRRDSEMANAQVQMMTMAAQKIQRSSGVNDDNRGIQTNAASGEAIKARQMQGSVVNTQPFDNLRLATQVAGEKELATAEQFMTQERVVRLTGAKDKIEWLRVNQPVVDPDGTVRILNDISASMSDFVVAEQDYAGTMRQVMAENLLQLASKLPPEMSIRLFIIAQEFSDLANKDQIVEEMRKVIGERDPNKPMTPEEQQAAMADAQAKQEAMEMQRQQNIALLQKAQGEARKVMAEAAKAEQDTGGQNGSEIAAIRAEADKAIEDLQSRLQATQRDYAIRILQVKKDADVRKEIALIEQETSLKVAAMEREHDARLVQLQGRINQLSVALQAERADAPFNPATPDAQEGKENEA
ncbi:hypothetical protein [Uliginosibacterium sp. 31-12]|uniref:portal protein n=1 Tax=Uliginosibacterium sp. 31-12 TaxID=3062781 RepID=UPI0026E11626|nr:hypothetical protein [Uliginosibacterium sp. 31-12]MDO6385588.1 hypothetical protein [Uliginosibacterium sp. 31-12]